MLEKIEGRKIEEKGMTEDELVGWNHRLNGHEFEYTLENSVGQGSLACCSPCCHEESDRTWQLKNNKNLFSTFTGLLMERNIAPGLTIPRVSPVHYLDYVDYYI